MVTSLWWKTSWQSERRVLFRDRPIHARDPSSQDVDGVREHWAHADCAWLPGTVRSIAKGLQNHCFGLGAILRLIIFIDRTLRRLNAKRIFGAERVIELERRYVRQFS